MTPCSRCGKRLLIRERESHTGKCGQCQAMPPVTIHIVGNGVMVGTVARQRCAWCGFLLMDDDWANIATAPGSSHGPNWWPEGMLIEVGSNWKSVIEHPAGEPLPQACCAAGPKPPAPPPTLRVVGEG